MKQRRPKVIFDIRDALQNVFRKQSIVIVFVIICVAYSLWSYQKGKTTLKPSTNVYIPNTQVDDTDINKL